MDEDLFRMKGNTRNKQKAGSGKPDDSTKTELKTAVKKR